MWLGNHWRKKIYDCKIGGFMEKKCNCGPNCKCGCQEGKPCTCKEKETKKTCKRKCGCKKAK